MACQPVRTKLDKAIHTALNIAVFLKAAKELSLIGSYGFTKQTIEQLVDLVANGKLSLETSITHTFPLEQVNQGLDVLHEKTGNPIRVVIAQ